LIYFDTSAVVKLVVPEAETVALQTWMKARGGTTFFSSQLLRIELLRAVARTVPVRTDLAREVLKGFALLRIDDEIVEGAEALHPPILRTLDAIHLATAQLLRQHVTAFVAYDARLIEAATAIGLKVVAPV
jgi:uncharacterized protein